MMMLILLSLLNLSWSVPPIRWATTLEVRERHEFYRDNEVILKPKGTWQTLFAVIYPNEKMNLIKECAFYKVPAEKPGEFKIKQIDIEKSCELFVEERGDLEVKDLKALQFSLDKSIVIHFTYVDFKTTKWEIPLVSQSKTNVPKILTSSAEYRSPEIILLASNSSDKKSHMKTLRDGELCHSIGDDCEELSSSECQLCASGWYEVPNGCSSGPKYCGLHMCGKKNQPACRRGFKYQRVDQKNECRKDPSFAYCSPGLTIQCEGARAYCR
jgi:hypothetical protein